MTEKRFEFREVNNCGMTPKLWDNEKQEYANLLECVDWLNNLHEENKELKDLLKSMADRNNEIWLDNGQIIRLKKVFKGEWTNDRKKIPSNR